MGQRDSLDQGGPVREFLLGSQGLVAALLALRPFACSDASKIAQITAGAYDDTPLRFCVPGDCSPALALRPKTVL